MSSDKVKLRRQVGLFSGIALIVGTMIGSGIFISPGGVLLRSGSVAMSLLVWIMCGVLSCMSKLMKWSNTQICISLLSLYCILYGHRQNTLFLMYISSQV